MDMAISIHSSGDGGERKMDRHEARKSLEGKSIEELLRDAQVDAHALRTYLTFDPETGLPWAE